MIKELAQMAHEHAKQFYTAQPGFDIYDKLSEENEEFLDAYLSGKTSNINNYSDFETDIKNSIGDELADIIIVSLAGSIELDIDIEKHIAAKIAYNMTRG